MRFIYPCILTPENDGGFFVAFPDVPGALTCGADRAEALAMAEDALVAILAVHVRERRDLPAPSPATDHQHVVPLPPVVAAKLALYAALREQHITEAVLAKRLEVDEATVDRLLDPDRYTHIGTVLKALRAVGRCLVVEDRAA